MNYRFIISILLVAALSGVLAGAAAAHTPEDHDWDWTCDLGDGTRRIEGDCYVHHSFANAEYVIGASVDRADMRWAFLDGHDAWDLSNGHEFDFHRWATNDGTRAWASAFSCGVPGVGGCADFVVNLDPDIMHIQEAGATIWVDPDEADRRLWDDIATHELGHYVGLGHSGEGNATMRPVITLGQQSAVTLHASDQLGRCQIYGHAHGHWGGC